MKKSAIITGVVCSLLFGSIGVCAGHYLTATQNKFPVQLNGENVAIEGYNINDNTYFKLRDIAATVGGFDVDFNNNIIQLSTLNTQDEYVDDSSSYIPDTSISSLDLTPYAGEWYDGNILGMTIDPVTVSAGSNAPLTVYRTRGKSIQYTFSPVNSVDGNTISMDGENSFMDNSASFSCTVEFNSDYITFTTHDDTGVNTFTLFRE